MGLGAPWAKSSIEHQLKEKSSVRLYINIQQPPKNCPGINPMGLGDTWSESYIEHKKRNFLL